MPIYGPGLAVLVASNIAAKAVVVHDRSGDGGGRGRCGIHPGRHPVATWRRAWQRTTPLADGLAQTITYFDKLLSERSLLAALRTPYFPAGAGPG